MPAFLSKYGVARHLYIPLIKRGVVDFAVSADYTPVAGDVKISKDGGAAANVTNLPSAITMGNTAMWDFSLTATEMQAAQVVVTVADSATKAVEDTEIYVETHGNASAQFQIDLADSVRAGLTALPNAAAAAAGGLMVLGVNATATSFTAGLTISNAGGDALVLSSSGSNGSGLAASGNGTGAGIKGTGGATGNGAQFVGGATSGSAIKASGTAGNAIGIEIAGQGSAAGLQTTGGATGIGFLINGGGTSGEGLFIATTNGDGIRIAPIGSSKHGMRIAGGSSGTSDGINVSAGTGGVAIRSDITGNITGNLSGSVGSVTARVTANADQLAGQTVTAGAGVTFPSSVASPTNITAGTITTVTNLTNAPTAGDFTATMKTSIGTAVAASAVASVTAGVTVTTNNDKTGYALTAGERTSVADALLDRADAVETGLTPRQALRLGAAADAGVLAGAATASVTIKNAVANSKTRITATVDSDGNRSVVTTDVT